MTINAMRRKGKAWLIGENGGMAVEAALIFPVLLVFFLLLVETTRLSLIYSMAEQAAYTGTRMAKTHPGSDPAPFIQDDFKKLTFNFLKDSTLTVETVSAPDLNALVTGDVTDGPGGSNDVVEVTLTLNAPLMENAFFIKTPFLGFRTWKVHYRNEKVH